MDAIRPRSLAIYAVVAGLAGSMLGVSSCDLPVPPVTTTTATTPTTTTVTTPVPTEAENDNAAKSAARNAVTAVEACYADTQTYVQCVGIPEIAQFGAIAAASGADNYSVSVKSVSGTTFVISRAPGGAILRTCAPAGATVGCASNGTW